MNALAMLGSICRNTNSLEHKLALRHTAVNLDSSWFWYIQDILAKLNLPTLSDLLSRGYTKAKWKSEYKRATEKYWRDKILRLLATYPSSRYLNPLSMKFGTPHPVISLAPCTAEQVKRTATTLQILAGTYMLQSNRANFNQHGTDSRCLLCKSRPENREHMIARCEATEHIRDAHRRKLYDILCKHCDQASLLQETIQNPSLFTQIVLDCTNPVLTHMAPFPCDAIREIIACCQHLTHSLSAERHTQLQRLAPRIQKKRKLRQRVQRVTKKPSALTPVSNPHA